MQRGKPLNPLRWSTTRTRCTFQAPLPARRHRGVRPLFPAGPLASPHDRQGRPACQSSLTKGQAARTLGPGKSHREGWRKGDVSQPQECMRIKQVSKQAKDAWKGGGTLRRKLQPKRRKRVQPVSGKMGMNETWSKHTSAGEENLETCGRQWNGCLHDKRSSSVEWALGVQAGGAMGSCAVGVPQGVQGTS